MQTKWLNKIHRIRGQFETRFDYLRLDKNERTSSFQKSLINFIKKKLNTNHLSTYPEVEKLYNSLAKFLGISKNMLVITAGSDIAIKNCFELFAKKNKKIITLSPTFAMIDIYSKLFQLNQIKITYDKNLNLDVKKIIKNINKKICLIVIANPNSPTGTIIEKKQLIEIINKANKKDIPILLDEAYFGFYKFSYMKFIKKFKNLIIVRTFSKAFGLAGIRAGYIVANSNIAQNLYKFKPMYEINSFAILVLNLILKSKNFFNGYVKETLKGKKYLEKKLKILKINYLKTYGNFIHLDLGKKRNFFIKIFKENKILAQKGPGVKGYDSFLRITLGPKKDMKRVTSLLNKYL